ncbi:hypothetical protein IMY05_009G0017100 [Salix suchowensis]|nr:hypothetical protein IMY05_009G0017100 [Salix suchowensis]
MKPRDKQSFITSLWLVSFWPCGIVDFILACRTIFIVVERTTIGKISITYCPLSFNSLHACYTSYLTGSGTTSMLIVSVQTS